MKMGSAKRKSSFRIDDILHQQRAEQNLLYQHHAALAGGQSHTDGTEGVPAEASSSLVYPSTPAASYGGCPPMPPTMPVDCSASGRHRSSTSPSLTTQPNHGDSSAPSPVSIGRADSPKKPTAMYPGLLDFSKNMIPLPLQLGVPTFNPINAAYLEHYASVLHKATPRVWPFYAHPYSYLLPACGSKRKGGQVRFTPQQTQSLEKRFSNHKYLSPEDRRNLAIQLKLSDRQVKTWFQNRRAKWRRANSGCQSVDGEGVTASGASAGYPGAVNHSHTHKYSNGADSQRQAGGTRSATNRNGYEYKSNDGYSDHDEDASSGSDDPDDENDDEPASPINVI
ncbi:hematopoietically-expressed homeobox protein HHEX [Anopheles darlingi]|uniref:hematopoietically-expressed homeobox protein HHEX n=1 Tax=Anopheles darlingi TaxID=43151 RepID=UPI00210011FC|nr:hematopoietically-expressed homeobox protein HHEX [Anopheles darlingi]